MRAHHVSHHPGPHAFQHKWRGVCATGSRQPPPCACTRQTESPLMRPSHNVASGKQRDASSRSILCHHQLSASPAGDKFELGPPVHVCHCCPVVVIRVKCEATGRHAAILHVPLAPALYQAYQSNVLAPDRQSTMQISGSDAVNVAFRASACLSSLYSVLSCLNATDAGLMGHAKDGEASALQGVPLTLRLVKWAWHHQRLLPGQPGRC